VSLNDLKAVEFTAIMPVRNSKSHSTNIVSIVESLEGLPIQLVIVADLHSPETEIDLKNLLSIREKSKIVLISGDFNSPGIARNAGLDFAVSNLVTFWDCDDKPIPSNTLLLARKMRSQSQEIGVGDFEFSDSNVNKPIRIKDQSLVEEITLYPGLWRMIFDRDRIHLPRFRDFRMAEDQVFLVEVEFEKRRVLREHLIVYRYQTNVLGQLTRDPQAILDTKKALNFLFLSYLNRESGLSDQRLLVSFIAKQILSMCKYRIHATDLAIKFLRTGYSSMSNFEKMLILLQQIGVQLVQKTMR
jgi:glycosyltransferase involved in cell wall biosynthesis